MKTPRGTSAFPRAAPRTTVLVPVKGLSAGKQRLAGVLSPDERRRLIETMLIDVVSAARSCDRIVRVVVATDDQDAVDLGSRCGATVLRGGGSSDYSRCVRLAVDHLRASVAGPIIVVPADVPLVRPDEFAAVADAIALPGRVALVEAEPDGGTNCIGLSPAAVIDFRFGPASFAAHLQSIERSNQAAVKLDLPGLQLDVDRPDDLLRLAGRPGSAGAIALACGFDLAARPAMRAALASATPDDRSGR